MVSFSQTNGLRKSPALKRLHEVQQGAEPGSNPPAAPAPAGVGGSAGGVQGGLAAAAQAAKAGVTGGRRDPVLDELRQRIDHSLLLYKV